MDTVITVPDANWSYSIHIPVCWMLEQYADTLLEFPWAVKNHHLNIYNVTDKMMAALQGENFYPSKGSFAAGEEMLLISGVSVTVHSYGCSGYCPIFMFKRLEKSQPENAPPIPPFICPVLTLGLPWTTVGIGQVIRVQAPPVPGRYCFGYLIYPTMGENPQYVWSSPFDIL